jgi:hypothetical protein
MPDSNSPSDHLVAELIERPFGCSKTQQSNELDLSLERHSNDFQITSEIRMKAKPVHLQHLSCASPAHLERNFARPSPAASPGTYEDDIIPRG